MDKGGLNCPLRDHHGIFRVGPRVKLVQTFGDSYLIGGLKYFSVDQSETSNEIGCKCKGEIHYRELLEKPKAGF